MKPAHVLAKGDILWAPSNEDYLDFVSVMGKQGEPVPGADEAMVANMKVFR